VNKLLEDIEHINKILNETEEVLNHWVPIQEIPVDGVTAYLDDTRVRVIYICPPPPKKKKKKKTNNTVREGY